MTMDNFYFLKRASSPICLVGFLLIILENIQPTSVLENRSLVQLQPRSKGYIYNPNGVYYHIFHLKHRIEDKNSEINHEKSWGYDITNGPQTWKYTFPECGGNKQSPILIHEDNLKPHLLTKELFHIKNYNTKPNSLKLENNGHTVQVTGVWIKSMRPYAMLNGTRYDFKNLHFHWGTDNSKGSEHIISGVRYPIEMHVVHQLSLVNGMKQFLVIGKFFQVGFKDNVHLNPFIDKLNEVTEAKSSVNLKPTALGNFVKDIYDFALYKGSLTTPPCDETVNWIISLKPSYISETQIKKFRKTENEDGFSIAPNFRPVQPFNHRGICRYNFGGIE